MLAGQIQTAHFVCRVCHEREAGSSVRIRAAPGNVLANFISRYEALKTFATSILYSLANESSIA